MGGDSLAAIGFLLRQRLAGSTFAQADAAPVVGITGQPAGVVRGGIERRLMLAHRFAGSVTIILRLRSRPAIGAAEGVPKVPVPLRPAGGVTRGGIRHRRLVGVVVAKILALGVIGRLALQAILMADGAPVTDLAVGHALHVGLAAGQQQDQRYQAQ